MVAAAIINLQKHFTSSPRLQGHTDTVHNFLSHTSVVSSAENKQKKSRVQADLYQTPYCTTAVKTQLHNPSHDSTMGTLSNVRFTLTSRGHGPA